MSESRFATKVGIFVFAGLLALAALLLNFSKSSDWFRPKYEILLRTTNVSGIKSRAAVLMAGVPIGYVKDVQLAADGKSVIMTVCIYQEFLIRHNATVAIEQSGFLGDQFVAITPRSNEGAYVQAGNMIKCLPPFDLQDTARRASDLLDSVGQALGDLRGAVSNINGSLLSPNSLASYTTNIQISLQNVRTATESARESIPPAMTNLQLLVSNVLGTGKDLQGLVQGHTAAVSRAILNLEHSTSNITAFTEGLKRTGGDLESLIATNRPRVDVALKNIETASISVTNMLRGLETDLAEGKGLVGGLLHDEGMKVRVDVTLSNVVSLSSNLNIAAGNLNQRGLWGILWKPKPSKTNTAATVKPAGKGH